MGDHGGPRVKDVLVVDDEPSLRLLCRVNLELDGHIVREAGTSPMRGESWSAQRPT